MIVVIGVLLGLILGVLLDIHKTMQEFQNTVMYDFNANIDATERINMLMHTWDVEGLPTNRGENV